MSTDNPGLRIAGLVKESVVDGPGLRGVVFFQGCPHQCDGCHNPETWDPAGGALYTEEEVWRMLEYHPLLSGITLSGGEPFFQPKGALGLAERTRRAGGDLIIYTGYLWEELMAKEDPLIRRILDLTFLLVDGPYKKEEKETRPTFRGSRNQRLIDAQESLSTGKVVLWKNQF